MSNGSERIPERDAQPCDMGICSANAGHDGTCAEASGWAEQAKVDYVTREGHHSTAYIDERTGHGTDKHTDVDVILDWSELRQEWLQIDAYEWEWRHDHFERVNEAAS